MAQDYDVSLKLVFRRSNGVATQRLIGDMVVEWLNVELPRVRNPRVDMLARIAGGGFTHLDLQSTNDQRWAPGSRVLSKKTEDRRQEVEGRR
jgi:hypothetical protein